MADENGVDISAALEEDFNPGRQYHRRRNNLTNDDLDAISAIVETIYKNRGHAVEDCLFAGIDPKDMKDMVDAFKEFRAATADSKKIARRFFVVLILTVTSGAAIYGWWAKISDAAKQAIIPGK